MSGRALPFWLDEPYEPRPPLEGECEADVCVIGAGVAGLSCALRLAGHGIDALVLERATVASGASGRNGGFLIAGVADFYPDVRERLGRDRARSTYARTMEVQEEMYELARSLGAQEDMRRVGLLRVGASPEEAEHVRRHARALREDGFPGELIERHELPPALRGFAYNGCRTAHDGALHPARWIRALALAAERAGARIREATQASVPVRAPGEGALVTDRGAVTARHVVVAADGALPALVPSYARRIRARRLHMVATAPVGRRLADELVYARWGYEYFQQRPDGRLLIGGFSDFDGERSYTTGGEGSPGVWERIERHLRDALGVAAPVTHRWVGVVGYSEDGLPFVGEVQGRRGLHVAGGYSGHGNVSGFLAGRQIADAIAGAAGPSPVFTADR
jgi:gamma-glutamylputrescine oxidase